MEDDGETLPDVDKPSESEMDEGKLEIEETGNAEECGGFPELGGERNELVSSEEDKPMTTKGEEKAVSGIHVAAEEGGGEIVASDVGDAQLEIKAEEGSKRVDDAKEAAAVTETRDVQLFSETLKDANENEIFVDPQLEMEAGGGNTAVVDSKVEVVVTDVDCSQSFSQLPMYTRGDELTLPSDREGMESCDVKSEREMAEGEKVAEVGGEEVCLGVSQTLKADTEMVVAGDKKEGQQADFIANYSEVGTAEKPFVIEVEKVHPVITNETPIGVVKIEMELVTEANTQVANFPEKEQVEELGGSIQYDGADVRDVVVENKDVPAEESLISETKMVEDENMSVKEVNDFKLDNPMNVTENRDDAGVNEELVEGNIRMEIEGGVDLEMTRNDVAEEVRLEDAIVKKGAVNEVVADKTLDKDTKMETEETRSVMDDPDLELDNSPAALQVEEDETVIAGEDTGNQDTEMETETDVAESGKASGGKRKRGKFSKSSSISKATAKASSRKTVGEDVCFICFDGGELVLCDRRGCPKAYHPSCVNRDDAFFRAKGRWNCGWHMCSICEKNALFMCYTCTFSLCKSCSKDAVILCVRGNKGFCETCLKTVMLIEKNEQGNKESPIDFDDRGSWEYLFKDYYIELKSKLSLSSEEVAEAKNPWKGTGVLSGPSKQESSEAQADTNDGGSGSDDSVENLKISKPKRRKVRKQSKSLTKEKKLVSAGIATEDKALSLSDNSEWASKELLEFVSHMKNGDRSALSQFDVQGLLLEYIKRNKLRDPRRKSQIICDARLEILFGKPRVGHFEMLKLLESHFLVRDEQNDDVQGSIVDTESNQLDVDGNADHLNKGVKDRKRKTRKKGDRGPQSNLDDYAAIDMHNISLIYLRRKLMEDLLEDVEKFHDKVVGMFVRIRISGNLQKQDLYRLVQVVGTSKAAEPYKIGKKTSDIVVEILNLDKTEIISIDTISNQEFTEEECKRLRQSIKCGLISRLTVGEILDKTMEIQAARVNDWLESETLRLSHLRDRASDLGRRKELRECVEKLQILKTPEERRRRLKEIPEIHADPRMDPSYESDENDGETEDRADDFIRSRGSGFSRRGRGPISPGTDSSLKDSGGGVGKASSKSWELSRNLSGNNFSPNATRSGEIVNENFWNLESDKDPQESNNLEKLSAANYESADRSTRSVSQTESLSGVSSVTPQASLPAGVGETSVKINETEKIWHYQDPSGKVQGPFSIVQLRKWNNTGYFPADLKIWRATEKQEDSIFMADALAGKFHKVLPPVDVKSPTTDTLHSPPILSIHGQTSGISLHLDRERPGVQQNPGSHTKLSMEKWTGNDLTNLPSPTPKQHNTGWNGGEGGLLTGGIQSPGVKGVLPTSTAGLPNIGIRTFPHASVLNSVAQPSTAFSPTPNSQQGILGDSTDSLLTESTVTSEPHLQMHGQLSATVQPVQHVISQIPLAETQGWGSSAQSGQPQGYGWGAPNTQNSTANFSNLGTTAVPQSEFWRPSTQGSQPNIYAPATPNVTWNVAPVENNTSLGVRPENPNVGWGMPQANPNIGWGNPAPGNTNVNRGPMQVPPTGNTNSGWIAAPAGNPGANMQGPVPGNLSSGWAATPGWGAPPIQGPVLGNGWGPPSGNTGAPSPVQGSAQGTANQGWVAPQGNQGTWGGEQNHSGQFSGQRNGQGQGQGQGRDSGFGGGRPWNRQSSFGGGPGGSRHYNKRETVCPYNTNGRCRKGAHCDYLHT